MRVLCWFTNRSRNVSNVAERFAGHAYFTTITCFVLRRVWRIWGISPCHRGFHSASCASFSEYKIVCAWYPVLPAKSAGVFRCSNYDCHVVSDPGPYCSPKRQGARVACIRRGRDGSRGSSLAMPPTSQNSEMVSTFSWFWLIFKKSDDFTWVVHHPPFPLPALLEFASAWGYKLYSLFRGSVSVIPLRFKCFVWLAFGSVSSDFSTSKLRRISVRYPAAEFPNIRPLPCSSL